MESSNHSSFPLLIPELDEIIARNLESIGDMIRLMLVNKYFYKIMQNFKLCTELQVLHSYIKNISFSRHILSFPNKIFDVSCRYGFKRIVKYIFSRHIKQPHHRYNTIISGLDTSCANGNLDIIKCLYSYADDIEIFHYESHFIQACSLGHLDVAKYIFSLKPTINIHARSDKAFMLACENGHIEIVKWFYQLEPDAKINIHVGSDHLLHKACRRNHLKVVKFLYQLSLSQPDRFYHGVIKTSFNISCKHGHLEISQFLYSTGEVNTQTNSGDYLDKIFHTSCLYNQSAVAEWLTTLCPRYKVEIIDGRISRFWC